MTEGIGPIRVLLLETEPDAAAHVREALARDDRVHLVATVADQTSLLDKLGAVVPMSDCRKIYMVFAPRFENVEQDLQDGCFLAAGTGASDATWTVDDSSKLTGGRSNTPLADAA